MARSHLTRLAEGGKLIAERIQHAVQVRTV